MRNIARQYGLTNASAHRHANGCLAKGLLPHEWSNGEGWLTGAYLREQPGASDVALVVKRYRKWLREMPDATEDEKALWLGWFSEESGVPLDELQPALSLQEVTERMA